MQSSIVRMDIRCARTSKWRVALVLLVVLSIMLTAMSVVFAQTTQMLMPKASGMAIEGTQGTLIDYGHSDAGYVIVQSTPNKKNLVLSIAKGDASYVYTLNNEGRIETYPLQLGSGRYEIIVYQHLTGAQYTVLDSVDFDVELADSNSPYLYPSQYVNYSAGTLAVQKSKDLCKNARSDREAFEAIKSYIQKNIKYNNKLAKTVKTGYLPNLDQIFRSRKGICFDYAALTACMLRVQGIPTQLVIGNVNGKYYHAWNKVMIGGQWLLYDPTFAASKTKGSSYAEERRY